AEELRERLEEGDPEEPLTREEAVELVELVEGALDRTSPERWDNALEVIAEEAARRAGRMSSMGPS
ncbi:MAG: hypothetical protein ABEJ46_01135, partial [Gemmatimonadota bacterium]